MSAFTYKCRSCGAGIEFSPESGDFACPYCGSHFTEEQLKDPAPAAEEAPSGGASSDADAERQQFTEHARLYNCPSCGAEVVGDDTTAATFCFYCHNPVVLAGQLSGDLMPDTLVPFAIDREAVREKFLAWVRGKWFVEPDFASEASLEKLTGVYFPFWVVDAAAEAELSATGTSVRVWRVGDVEHTETSVYDVRRAGSVRFEDVTVKALSKQEARLLDGIYPFRATDMKPFSMPFLSGFFADKRDIGRAEAEPDVNRIIDESATKMLRATVTGYNTVSVTRSSVRSTSQKWDYALMPAWTLTYQYRGESYYFAMNGQTGKVAGRVPASRKKLAMLFAGMWAGVSLLLGFLGVMVF